MVGRRPAFWDRSGLLSTGLLPLAGAFGLIVAIRREAYRRGLLRSHRLSVPVIVIGNITVGGSGKTPLVLWIARFLLARGWKPGIVSRGYGGRSDTWPRWVSADSDPGDVGDEPVLLARRSGCSVAVGPDRARASELLVAAGCEIVVSDDGMQHYALERDLEIMVCNGRAGLGNGRLLPAGPLREPPGRLTEADLTVTNGDSAFAGAFRMDLSVEEAVRVNDAAMTRPLSAFAGQNIEAVAGIGYPESFFRVLREAGLVPRCHDFPDHHRFKPQHLDFDSGLPVFMTEKDAVKCTGWAPENFWYVPVIAQLPDAFGDALGTALNGTSS